MTNRKTLILSLFLLGILLIIMSFPRILWVELLLPLITLIFLYVLYRLTIHKSLGKALLIWFLAAIFLHILIAISATIRIHIIGGYNESPASLIITYEAFKFIVPISLAIVIFRRFIKQLLQNRSPGQTD